jgi:transketolase
LPCWELFDQQPKEYRDSVLPPSITKRLSIEAGVAFGWSKYAAESLSIDRFGASAPAKIIAEKFGFTVENVVARAKQLID